MAQTMRKDQFADEIPLCEIYFDAVADYVKQGSESQLSMAFGLGRRALEEGLSLVLLTGIHNEAVSALDPCNETDRQRVEQFFLETVTVYDMAQRGYRDAVSHLREEVAERKKVEEDLRAATFELVRQRDELDDQVQQRTAELQKAVDELKNTNSLLKQANEEQAEFSYALSHDLRSPLNTISMMLDILGTDIQDPNEEVWQVLDAARATAYRMLGTVEDVLNYSRAIESAPTFEEVDLNELLSTILADLDSDISSLGAKISVTELPVLVGDATQFRILLQNLISNAMKFRVPGRTPIVSISATDADDDHVGLHVADNGIGISEQYLDRIFGLFQRLHNHDEYQGTGLGLTLCKRIAVNHCGQIVVDSTLGEGSTFSVLLKRYPVGAERAVQSSGTD